MCAFAADVCRPVSEFEFLQPRFFARDICVSIKISGLREGFPVSDRPSAGGLRRKQNSPEGLSVKMESFWFQVRILSAFLCLSILRSALYLFHEDAPILY